MDRRRFLQQTTAAGLLASLGQVPLRAWADRTASEGAPPVSPATGAAYAKVAAFPSGILSGDPSTDGVVLWTRIDPASAVLGGGGAGATVTWEVSTDPAFGTGTVVASGSVVTSATTDHTVKVEVDGLGAGATRWYRFSVDVADGGGGAVPAVSPVGRTRTLPVGSVDHLRIAYFSCERYVHGYYTAHADLAALALDPATDVDLVICLGDYVYEAGPADDVTVPGRVDADAPQVTLEDFRRQYHLYRTDLDLQAMHAAFPFVGIFDNHDGFSDPSDPAGPGARAAFFEQMPVRVVPGDPNRQHRSFRIGDLVELFLLDERQHRDPTPDEEGNPLGTVSTDQPEMCEPGRTMLGAAQLDWLQQGLAGSSAAWKVIGSQLMFAPLRSQRDLATIEAAGDGPQRNAGRYVNLVQWDGYQAERRTIVDGLQAAGVEDVVSIAGDTHFWTASEVPLDYDDPEAPLVLVEFGGSSITSANAGEMAGLPGNDLIRPVVAGANPYSLRYMEVTTHGYGLLDLTPERLLVEYRSPATIREATSSTTVLASFEVARGTARIEHVSGEGFLARPEDEPVVPTTQPVGPGDPDGQPPAAVPIGGAPGYTG